MMCNHSVKVKGHYLVLLFIISHSIIHMQTDVKLLKINMLARQQMISPITAMKWVKDGDRSLPGRDLIVQYRK